MSRERATEDDIRVLLKLAGHPLSDEHFNDLCRAYKSVENVLERIPTDLTPAAEPAHVFDPRSFMPKGSVR